MSLAHVQRGDQVVDLATGTATPRGRPPARAHSRPGLDAAPRQIDVARERAVGEGVDASFVVGNMQAPPFDDGSFDVALSVFGRAAAAAT